MTRPVISLQALIGPGDYAGLSPFIIGTSLIGGTDVIGGAPTVGVGTWVELGERCATISTRRGRQRLLEQYRAGTLGAVLDNTDGHLDPAWDEGPFTTGLPYNDLTDESGLTLTDESGFALWTGGGSRTSNIRPMRVIKVEVFWAGVTYPLFYGFTDAWDPQASYPEGGTVVVTATDPFKVFNRIDPLEQSSQGAGEDTGARLDRILDVADWAVEMRDIDTGDNTHQATTLAQPITTQMRLAADSERGDLYMDARGFVTFRRRLSRYLDFRSTTVLWTIGDGDGELNPAEFTVANDDDLVRNDVNLARVGGSLISRRSPAGEVPYLRSSYTRTDLTLESDVQVADQATTILHLFAMQQPRVDTVTFEPDGFDDHDLWHLCVSSIFGDRVTVNLRHPDTGVLFAGDYFIEGIDHDIPVLGSGQWRTTFHLADATKFPTHPFIIGTSLIGGSDVIA